jgi:hypothetical protein
VKIFARTHTCAKSFSRGDFHSREKIRQNTCKPFDWFRYYVIQNTRISLASLFPFRNGVETNTATRRREIFRRETFQNHVAHAFNLFARNFSHFARRGIKPLYRARFSHILIIIPLCGIHAVRSINLGQDLMSTPANVLEDLQWSTLDVRRHRLKSVLMIINDKKRS